MSRTQRQIDRTVRFTGGAVIGLILGEAIHALGAPLIAGVGILLACMVAGLLSAELPSAHT
jgi:hypothetical protein